MTKTVIAEHTIHVESHFGCSTRLRICQEVVIEIIDDTIEVYTAGIEIGSIDAADGCCHCLQGQIEDYDCREK